MSSLMDMALIGAVMASTLRGTTPILLGALGETFVERSGLLNLGLEGMMVAGAFASFLVGFKLDSLILGFVAAAAVGMILGLLFGFMTITLRVNQIVVGLGITIFAHASCSFLHRVIFGNQFPIMFTAGQTHEVPFLSKIPLIGQPLFDQHWLLYLTFLSVPVLYFIMYKTSLGLRIQAVGETPWAADSSGVNVLKTRYIAILFGGVMGGLAGAFMSLGDLAFFVPNMIMGRGYIAIVVVMLGKWDPFKVFLGALLFGFSMSLTSALQVAGVKVSPDFILMTPYLVVIATLLIFARSTNLPAALCVPYERGQK